MCKRLARAISSAFIWGGGDVRLGEVRGDMVGGDGVDIETFRLGSLEGDDPVGTGGERRSGSICDPAGPGVGLLPSRYAFAISAAFHFAYFILPSVYGANQIF